MVQLTHLRVVTLNLWGEQPPLEARMRAVEAELRRLDADLIALQEVRQIGGVLPNQAETLARALGYEWHFVASTPWGGGEEGLALLSRLPILARHGAELPDKAPPESEYPERRVVAGVTVETAYGTLAAFTTHLTYRMQDGDKRARQIVAAEALAAATPSDLPRLIMGDLNAVPEADEVRWLRGLCSLDGRRVYYQDAWARCHPGEAGVTWARANPYTEKLAWLERDRRIDYIFAGAERRDGRGVVDRCALCFTTPDAEGHLPSDHFGLVADLRLTPT